MISTLFIFQIVLLVLGFFAGYWFLTTSAKQENRLKIIGEILGWIIIAETLFLLLCNFFLSIKIVNQLNNKPHYLIQQEKPTINQEDQEDIETPLIHHSENDSTNNNFQSN